jgi:GTPase
MTKEHLGLSLALNVPVFVVLTKIDICPANVLQDTINILLKILKSPGCRKLPYLVENHDDVVTCALNFTSERYNKLIRHVIVVFIFNFCILLNKT